MSDTFTLLDLRTQAAAVRKLLVGCSGSEKIAWLKLRGELIPVPVSSPKFPRTFLFTSRIGMECAFFFDGDDLVILGDHSTLFVVDK